ncbi:cytochrome-c oxidase, cbb3-type subunit II [Shewanella sp. 1_MG-2023]|uniref:cytochrome-c oxidase, cbb3-type subunit II n=1 Tax=unclassified Shewanella TaxID=196818 RepID=UPI000C841E9C|nr:MULTISPECIES: cytochrome-c oxidase, cbb3-type subunit II [unclassified Shewanella]MDO6613741.1 cytochrome-c oxidase, cbb3-type subunit II [Shewanella sp. 7_MG-2023]MDO6772651.1 cytochrome-c oxidase, cbb3-type subunit II [Shewanella sp. 2_MG-2023]MDO6796545.1 cytochrome-c oxidase, cbb3-type subunit II [Shewanella sp. 1_MG-2023]PMG78158.1 cytochrome-c oxidase, cbb3-type subunit II [Shewanella sp. 10N.286.51.B7]
MKFNHEIIEKNIGLLGIFTVIAISFGGLVQITPLLFSKDTTEPVEGLIPYTALQTEGRDIYVREGCYNCHSQMIRPLRAETERYGHYSVAGESVWDHPFQWGSKRTGPDLARVGGRYSDKWHEVHLINPRDVVPQSNMPAYPWLAENKLDGKLTGKKMQILSNFHPDHNLYTEEEIARAQAAVEGKTELEALIAYLQSLGHALK